MSNLEWPSCERRPIKRAGQPDAVVHLLQVVAYNLAAARIVRRWSQAEACRFLRTKGGLAWSVATLSAAESGWKGRTGRVRHFDAVELVAFSLTFELPISWFLLPPPREDLLEGFPQGQEDVWIEIGQDGQRRYVLTEAKLGGVATRLDGSPEVSAAVAARVRQFETRPVGPRELVLRDMQRRLDELRDDLQQVVEFDGPESER